MQIDEIRFFIRTMSEKSYALVSLPDSFCVSHIESNMHHSNTALICRTTALGAACLADQWKSDNLIRKMSLSRAKTLAVFMLVRY